MNAFGINIRVNSMNQLIVVMEKGCFWGGGGTELLTGLLFIRQVIYEHGEPRWNDIDRECC
jgi:hypothetical protein